MSSPSIGFPPLMTSQVCSSSKPFPFSWDFRSSFHRIGYSPRSICFPFEDSGWILPSVEPAYSARNLHGQICGLMTFQDNHSPLFDIGHRFLLFMWFFKMSLFPISRFSYLFSQSSPLCEPPFLTTIETFRIQK